jgi:predicted anti-sigma-YlaC factor YlaD
METAGAGLDPDELTCQQLVELVTDYLEGVLSPIEVARFEAHLLECDGCPMYVDQFRTTIRLAGRLDEAQVSPEVRATLLKAFQAWHQSHS